MPSSWSTGYSSSLAISFVVPNLATIISSIMTFEGSSQQMFKIPSMIENLMSFTEPSGIFALVISISVYCTSVGKSTNAASLSTSPLLTSDCFTSTRTLLRVYKLSSSELLLILSLSCVI